MMRAMSSGFDISVRHLRAGAHVVDQRAARSPSRRMKFWIERRLDAAGADAVGAQAAGRELERHRAGEVEQAAPSTPQ